MQKTYINFICNFVCCLSSGGHFGRLDITYRTSEFDVISTALDEGRNLLVYFDAPVRATLTSATVRPVNLTAQRNPLTACAAFCLRETTCHAFSMSNISGVTTCNWVITGVNQLTDSTQVLTYIKNFTALSPLFSSRATAGIDYLPVTSQVATMFDGAGMANLTVAILTDSLPEMDESFMIHILRADLINLTAVSKNMPSLGQPNTARVTIAMNGDAFGTFLLYSLSPSATMNGLYLEVKEEPHTSVSLVIERRGGSMGQVTVEWKFVGGTALPKADFNGTGETLIFAQGTVGLLDIIPDILNWDIAKLVFHYFYTVICAFLCKGDLKKTIEIFIMDDMEPEDNETVMIGLVNTEGGSRIQPSSDTVTIVILANDHLAGVVGFHDASRSVTAREGVCFCLLTVTIYLSDPAIIHCLHPLSHHQTVLFLRLCIILFETYSDTSGTDSSCMSIKVCFGLSYLHVFECPSENELCVSSNPYGKL